MTLKKKKMNTLHPASFSFMEPPALLESHLLIHYPYTGM